LEIVLDDVELDRRWNAAHELGGRLAWRLAAERLEPALLVDRDRFALRLERVVEVLAQTGDRAREQLDDQVLAVAIDRDARQAIGLAVDEPRGAELAAIDEPRAQRDRRGDACAHERAVDQHVRTPDKDADRDRALG